MIGFPEIIQVLKYLKNLVTRLRGGTGKMWLQSKTAIHTTKFAGK